MAPDDASTPQSTLEDDRHAVTASGPGGRGPATDSAPANDLEPVATSRGVWVTIALVTAAAFLLPLRAMLHTAGPAMEEGFMLVFPERVLHGAIPNKDFLNLYGPGSVWLLAGVYKVFGVGIMVERTVGLIQLAGAAVGTALLVRWWGHATAATAVVLSAMFLAPTMQLTAIPWMGAMALGLLAAAALVQARHDSGLGRDHTAARWAVVGGVLAGLAILYRIDLGLAVVLAGTAALWGLPRRPVRAALLGLACGLAPYAVHVALAGPGTVVRGLIVDPVFHLRSARRLPVPPDFSHLHGVERVIGLVDRWWPLPRLTPPHQLFVWFVLLAAITPVVIVIALLATRREPRALRPRVLLVGSLFALGVFPQAVQRADGIHFAWVSSVLVALVPAAVVELARMLHPRWRPSHVAIAASALVIAACTVTLPTYTARRYIALVQDSTHRAHTVAIVNEGRTFYSGDRQFAHSIEALLHTVEQSAKPGSRIIVGNTDMRRVPYNDSFLYYLLPQYQPGTRFIEFEPGITNRRGTVLTREMQRADVFIASDRWLTWDEPNSSMKPGDPGPRRVLLEEFCPRDDFGNGYKLFLRCAPKP